MDGSYDFIAQDWQPQTALVRGGLERSPHQETCEALYLTSGFVYDTAEEAEAAFKGDRKRYIYGRYGNPTVATFEERLRLLEGADTCRATATGMAALHAALVCQLSAGDKLVASRALFGSCNYIISELLPRFGVETQFVDGTDYDQWEAAIGGDVTVTFFESPSNPTLEIIDIKRVAELTHAAGGKLVVDNALASPVVQKPLALGADVVIYSATKHIDGQGRSLGGAILGEREIVEEKLSNILRHTGPSLSPFNAWLMLKGLETLDLRVERQSKSAHQIAVFLMNHPRITKVHYPGLADHPDHALAKQQMRDGGTVVTFEFDGGKQTAFRFMNALELANISNNLGDSKSLVTHPATTTHQRIEDEERTRLGITESMVRFSIGLEDVSDLISDIERALTV
ncbi:MAG TPA: O-succinylhomoserine sulfhydrylase [Rhodospirillaceae bacterium]|nr:O-succinylhomoserine sulfhydrylase [Rhodospirillaceae bacterium]